MLHIRRVYDFAVNYYSKFQDKNTNYKELTDSNIFDGLDFETYYVEDFLKLHRKAFDDFHELAIIIDKIEDIEMLISTIYSKWKKFINDNKEDEKKKIIEFNNRAWFVLTFARLSILAKEKLLLTLKTPKKIRIVSNVICDGIIPENNDIIKQDLIIKSNGSVEYFGYKFRNEKNIQMKEYKIPKKKAENILNKVLFYFNNEKHNDIFTTDSGIWELEITDFYGEVHKLRGSMHKKFRDNTIELSDLIRDSLENNDLYVFDFKKINGYFKYKLL